MLQNRTIKRQMKKYKKVIKEVEEEILICDCCGEDCLYFQRTIKLTAWEDDYKRIIDISQLELCSKCIKNSLEGNKFNIKITLEDK
jgi:hypothetical protein